MPTKHNIVEIIVKTDFSIFKTIAEHTQLIIENIAAPINSQAKLGSTKYISKTRNSHTHTAIINGINFVLLAHLM
jgi:hypothetical protein